jgi:hypothetical protein
MSFVFEYKLFLVCIFALEYLGLTKLGIVVGVSEITKYHAIKGKIRNDAQQSLSVQMCMMASRINQHRLPETDCEQLLK